MAGVGGGEEIGGICMNKYLGMIAVTGSGGLSLDENVYLPLYGGLALSYKSQEVQMFEAADDLFASCDSGMLALAVDADRDMLASGEITTEMEVLGAVSSVEEAVWLYCRYVSGLVTLKDCYCSDVPAAGMWSGSVEEASSNQLYVSSIKEWDMDLSNVLQNVDNSDDFLIVTNVPKRMIENRGVPMLGIGWIVDTKNTLPDIREVHKSLVQPDLYVSGNLLLTERVLEMYEGKVTVC